MSRNHAHNLERGHVMAKGKSTKKAPAQSAEELAAQKALDSFLEATKGKELSDAQKAQKKALAAALGRLKFVRIANKRIPRALKAVGAIAKLAAGSYVKNAAQVDAIVGALEAEVKAVKAALSGVKGSESGFKLPGFNDGEQK